MAAPVYYSHPASLEHDTGAHPERAARIVAVEEELERRGWLGYARREAPRVARADLEAVHPGRYITGIRELCEAGGGHIDLDTVASFGSWEAAQRAAGGAVALVDALLDGRATAGASVLRPPGHHAEPARAMGFCLFNNVAVAARHAVSVRGVERVLILDWDVHHGNGTEAIFRTDSDVLYASIHEWPLYPGPGPASAVGAGEGRGFTVNLPVPAGAGDAQFVSLVEHVVAPVARDYRPGLVLISAGFDAHRGDPLAMCDVTDAGYAAMAGAVRRFAADVGAPVGLVLEGGYALEALARGLADTLAVLGAVDAPPADAVPVDPLSSAAADRLSEWWPSLRSVAARSS
ncbi:MAG: histone deacetylase [Solirubrobacteraceae bacterium]